MTFAIRIENEFARIYSRLFVTSKSIVGLCLLISSCAYLPFNEDELRKKEEARQIEIAQAADYEQLQSLLIEGDFKKAQDLAQKFREQYPNSNRIQATRIVTAKALIGLGEEPEALSLLRELVATHRDSRPEIAARSSFLLGEIYLREMKDSLALAAFIDAERLQDSLEDEVKMADLPVRLAALHARFSDWQKAQAYLQEAEIGIAKLIRAKPNLDPNWVSGLYLKLGKSIYQVPSLENYSIAIKTMRVAQVQLLRAMAVNSEPNSSEAMHILISDYEELYTVATSYEAPTGLEPLIRNKMKKQANRRMLADYLELIKDLKLWLPFGSQKMTENQTEFRKFVQFKEDLAFRGLHKDPFDTLLTKESEISSLQKVPTNQNKSNKAKHEEANPAKHDQSLNSEDPNL